MAFLERILPLYSRMPRIIADEDADENMHREKHAWTKCTAPPHPWPLRFFCSSSILTLYLMFRCSAPKRKVYDYQSQVQIQSNFPSIFSLLIDFYWKARFPAFRFFVDFHFDSSLTVIVNWQNKHLSKLFTNKKSMSNTPTFITGKNTGQTTII